uniref:PGF-CTERM archaeal protein-sorting signal domain-containing protein n=1 Tax=Candidatus Methanogaster sp. ANME-2c ERB4 TaxID=2759911 RepID=A0A7G9Y4K0_9EURY|nr:hypothetical protein FPLJOMBM_00025 [Methanosarcinales archaeon ANME-2c ERB4]
MLSLKWDREKKMKSKSKKIGLVVLTAILAIAAISVATVGAQPVEVWNITASGTYPGRAIATAGDCVYLAGLTDPGGASFGDAFLNKYNSTDGTLIWNITWGGTGCDYGWATATDDSMVYLAGTCPAGKKDSAAFLNKYDKDGNLIWNVTWGGTADDAGNVIATASDCVYLAGDRNMFSRSEGGYSSVFLNKYDKDGNLIWNITWGGTDFHASYARAATTGDYVYLAGNTIDKIIFLNKYDKDGNLIWHITWGEKIEWKSTFAIATGDSAVYLAGITGRDAFLNKYDKDGNLLWNTTWENATGWATATGDNAVYLAGWRGDDILSAPAFLNKYNCTDGTLIWNMTRGVNATGMATATGDNAVYLAGTSNDGAFLVKYSEPTPTPSENETLKCKTLWYFDDQSVQCQQDKFCGDYMYESLRTFETEEECKVAFETYLKEKGEGTLECKTLWYFDDQSVKCQQDKFCGDYMYESLRTFETEEECKEAFEKYLKEKGEGTLECKTLWYFDDQSVKCQQDKFCGDYMYESLRTFETEEECKEAFEKYLKEKGKETSTPTPPGFELGFAIAGLLAVAYLVRRRRK